MAEAQAFAHFNSLEMFIMFIRILIALAIAVISSTGFARTSDLSVRLSLADRSTQTDQELVLDVTFTNIGATPLTIAKWLVPDGELEGDLFFLSNNGQPVAYYGPIVKRAAPTTQDLMTLLPGESVTGSVDIATYYDFSRTGVYSIQYGVSASQIFPARAATRAGNTKFAQLAEIETLGEVLSNEVTTVAEGRDNPLVARLEKAAEAQRSLSKSISYAGRCSATQQTTIQSAVGASQSMANGSVNYLSAAPAATPRFTTWFGTYSTANWNQIKGQFVSIKDALDNKPLTFDCSCKKQYYAYVYPTQPYKVYLCRAFWSAPLTGTDSKGGTIIHELSHFNVVVGTDDYAYGHTAAKALAISDPAKARFNADSHEYFAENTPALP